jgi:hypothetical protein
MNGSLCFAHTDAQSRPRPLTRRDVNRSARVGCWPRKTSVATPRIRSAVSARCTVRTDNRVSWPSAHSTDGAARGALRIAQRLAFAYCEPDAQRLSPAVAGFVTDRDLAPSSHRMYTLTMDRLVGQLGPDMPVAEITTTMLARFLATTYAHLAPASYKRVVATLGSLFAYTSREGLSGVRGSERSEGGGGNWGGPPRPGSRCPGNGGVL